MKRIFSIFPWIGALALAIGLQGCNADVNLNDIDTSIGVDAKLATPLGSLHITLGDFIGTKDWGIHVENGVLTFKDTFSIDRRFHDLDLSQYISDTTLTMNVYEQLGGSDYIYGTGRQTKLKFPMTMKLAGINDDVSYQRLDSALIEHASFVSTIRPLGGLPIEWEWIDSVTIQLDKKFFHRQAGNSVAVYKRGGRGGYDERMPIDVDEFSLNLMKNRHPQGFREYWDNVVDSCGMDIVMHITIPKSAGRVDMPSTAAFVYDLEVQFIDYHAVWGMFEPSSDMSSEDEVVIAETWSLWKDLSTAKLPFHDPSIDMQITTQIAGALKLTGEYLYTKGFGNDVVYATFGDDVNTKLYKTFDKSEYLPLDSEIGASKTMHQLFDKDKQRGRIDRLFSIHPEKLGYKYAVDFDAYETPQIRITNNTTINVDAICNFPFIFNEGVMLSFSDTIANIDLSTLNLDSLLSGVAVVDTLKEASVTLGVTFTNDIPFQIRGVFTCLDENGNVVIDPQTNKPLRITQGDTVLIPSPTFNFNELAMNWIPNPTKRMEIIHIDKEDLETLRQVKSIEFLAQLDDESLSDVFKQGNFTTKLTPKEGLRVKLAIGADLEAILKLSNEQ